MNREAVLEPFCLEHLEFMDIEEDISSFKERWPQVADAGDAATIYYDGKIIGAMGYYEMWLGVCELWIFKAKGLEMCGAFGLILRNALSQLIDSGKFHRLQATSDVNEVNEKFFFKMGFQKEGVLRQFTIDRQDCYIWSRVK